MWISILFLAVLLVSVVVADWQAPFGSSLSVVTFILIFVLFPAVFVGLLSLGFYYVLAKAQPTISRLAPVLTGLLLAFMVPVLSFVPVIQPVLLVLSLVIISMGVLTSFMLLRNRLPDRRYFSILFLGSGVTSAVLLVYGFAIAFRGGALDPVTQFLVSLSLPEIGLPVLSLVLIYLVAVFISAIMFGAVLVTLTTFWRQEVRNG